MKPSDSAIIDAVLAGDTRRYGELVDRYQNRLMRYVWNLLGNHHDCEEIIQETFMQGFRRLPRFDSSKASFETWLTVIARRKSLNQIQKMRPRAYADPPDTACLQNLNQRILDYEWQQELDDALAKLPFEQRSAFILVELQEKSYREAAKIEGVPTGTIKSRVGRAKKRLRNSISKPVDES